MARAQFLNALKGDAWISAEIRKIFYSDSKIDEVGDYLTALTFVILARHMSGLETTVITTNFDDLLEREIGTKELDELLTFKPIYDETTFGLPPEPDGTPTVRVHHIHGYIPAVGPHSNIVLTLEQFASIHPDDWSERLLSSVSDDDVWLAVGMGLTDLHVLRHVITRAKREGGVTYALLARHSRNDYRHDDDLFFFLDKSVSDGYKALNITPLIMDWYSELAIFLDEVFRLTWVDVDESLAGLTIAQRFSAWRNEVERLDSTALKNGFLRRESKISPLLAQLRDDVSSYLRSELHSDETLKIEYWELLDDRESLRCAASSDGLKFTGSSRPILPLSTSSPWASVQACISGLVTVVEVEKPTSRWQTFFAIPLRIWDKGYDGVPAGSLVVSSTVKPSSLIGDDRVRAKLLSLRESVEAQLASQVRSVTRGLN